MKKIIEKAAEKFNTDKKTAVIILIGIAGVILLVISEIIPLTSTNDNKKKSQNEATEISCSDYEKEIEERLQSIISKIEGAGNVSVMVTLDSTVESVYAQEEKQSGENKNYENQYVIIKTHDGEGGILLKTTEPQIRGVAIVCTGGNSAVVCQNITNTVTAVLGISSARVNITAMKKDNGG